MALTVTEQMNMINGVTKPPSNVLMDLVHQSAMKYGVDFINNYTVFATSNAGGLAINANASNHVAKMMGVARAVFNADQVTVASLRRTIVTLIGASSITNAQVVAANDAAWESTIYAQMPKAFELLAGVTKAETTNYTSPVAA